MRDKFMISVGGSRKSTKWKNDFYTWEQFCARVSSPTKTQESYAEYLAMDKVKQDNIKDVGGFVCGFLTGGKRSKQSIESRSMLTLDVDHAPEGLMDEYEVILDSKAFMYTTHKHCAEKPRFRLIMPLSRDVTPDEYSAVARMVAFDLGIESFDDTTYQPERLMYWPSHSRDGLFRYVRIDGDILDPDVILNRYPDWKDQSVWPRSSRDVQYEERRSDKQEDPRSKPGVIGAFCRTYNVHDVISEYLLDIYAPSDISDDRYTYTGGSTSNGLVVYQDGDFAYSNHSTDPASGRLLNSFDLMRVHWYGDKDKGTSYDTPVQKLPSYKAMLDFATNDDKVRRLITEEKLASAKTAFEDDSESDAVETFEMDGKGKIKSSIHNVLIALRLNKAFKGVRKNYYSGRIDISSELPWGKSSGQWGEEDDVQLRYYLETIGDFAAAKVSDGIEKYAYDRGYHPIKEYFDSLPVWDGEPRAETYFVDALGAEDTEYTRIVTRKHLCMAVKRIMEPGCKYDVMLVIRGPQGKGKSTAIAKLGGPWYSDSLRLSDMTGKVASEKMEGYWIHEIAELAGMKSAEAETVKAFLSRVGDNFRGAYEKRTLYRPRQCIFFGTTNSETGYLRDTTGNRRFWDMEVSGEGKKFKPWKIPQEYIDQLWAEVLTMYETENGELPERIADEAKVKQSDALESDPREGLIMEYLDELLPDDWYSRSVSERCNHLKADYSEREHNSMRRLVISSIEVCCECFGVPMGRVTKPETDAVARVLSKSNDWVRLDHTIYIPKYGSYRVFARKGYEHLGKDELIPRDIGKRFENE